MFEYNQSFLCIQCFVSVDVYIKKAESVSHLSVLCMERIEKVFRPAYEKELQFSITMLCTV